MIKFGPSGNSTAFYDAGFSKSQDSAVWCKNLDLNAFEYSFGRGVNMSDQKAMELSTPFLENGVEISVHAPYYINLANPDEEMVAKSFGYIINSAKKVKLLGGNRVIYHPASQGKMDRETAVSLTLERHKRLCDMVYKEGLDDILFCPETMGKLGQIGTIEEVTSFCTVDKIFIPTVDFGHVNAREQGSLKTTDDYLSRLNYMIDRLGLEKMKIFHIHFSKIEYSSKGEVRHLTFDDEVYGPDFTPLAKAIKQLGLTPTVICESAGTQDKDAVMMKGIYESL
ncbi:MAG: endonuclease IV [Clostridiales bacterium]|nr:endonuclease IV [Clostridiales bacterium]